MDLGQQLAQVREGRLTFDEVVRASEKRWERLAQYIGRRWYGPAWHGNDDLKQEILVAAWDAVWRFDERRAGRSERAIVRYVVFNAVDRAKKRRHSARGARQGNNPDSSPARFEMLAPDEDAERVWAAATASAPEQERRMEAVEHALALCRTRAERIVVRALAQTGCLATAAQRVYDDASARALLGVRSSKEANVVVRKTAETLAERAVQC
jgi:DNA-directed RNA polymerase specialized sigma24 family protein